MLPDMDGFDVLRNLRADAPTRDLPVLMLTAKGQSADRDLAAKLGVTRFMTKPFANADVVAAHCTIWWPRETALCAAIPGPRQLPLAPPDGCGALPARVRVRADASAADARRPRKTAASVAGEGVYLFAVWLALIAGTFLMTRGLRRVFAPPKPAQKD